MLLKKYSDFGGGKKKPDSDYVWYNLKLNSVSQICALRGKKKENSNSRVVQKEKNLSEKNTTIAPPPAS
jgi:hypothetical protein